MKLKASQVMNATVALATIINEKRPLSQKGAYRVAQMHARLLPEWKVLEERRVAIVEAHQAPVASDDPDAPVAFAIPADKQAEADAKWAEVLSDEIEVNVEPIPLAYLDLGDAVAASISAAELQTLDDLVCE